MDRRSWPWKKKSSEKSAVISESVSVPASSVSQSDKVKQDSYKKPNYVQISVETYSHLTGLEDQVKSYDEQVKRYEDQIKYLEDEVKQHARVAEEAVSGWEKAEAEIATLKIALTKNLPDTFWY